MEVKKYHVSGPYGDPYLVEATSEQEALDKCIEYEQTMYDSWASCSYCEESDEWIEDKWPYDYYFKIISEEEFMSYVYYEDLVNYDFEKNCYWSSTKFCDTVKIDKSKFERNK